jgi:anti-sigma-K factor RskA
MKIDLSDEIEHIRNQTAVDGYGEEVAENIKALRQHIDEYYAHQEAREREQDTKSEIYRKKQLWHDWRVAIISAAVGVILTLMVQHFSDIINFFKVLLQ